MHANTGFYSIYGKRVLDIAIVAPVLIILAPLMALLSFLVRLQLGPHVYFHQLRPGLDGVLFVLHKFRTMSDARTPGGQLFPDAARLTRFGRLLRSTSLDELPELWNVLRGDMSLVGPRPEEERVVEFYTDYHRRRLAVKPGLTGPMQINGRGNLPFSERLQLELDYIEHYSLRRDLAILLRTVPVLLHGKGAR